MTDTNQDSQLDNLIELIWRDEVTKAEAKAALNSYIKQQVVAELQYVLSHSSGGGSWRRVIITRIRELEK